MKVKLSREEMKKTYSGMNLRHFRDEKCYSQEYISNQLGLSQSTYQRIESGEIKISIERLKKLADIFEKPLEDLINLDKNSESTFRETISVSLNEWNLMKKIIEQQEKTIKALEEKLNINYRL